MGRAPCCDKAKVKKGPWSPEEDDKLKSYIEKHGTGGNWITLPHKIGLKRCGKSCRLRWLNYLRPNIKHGGFTEDEDNLICSLYITIGSRWSVIAAQLPGRTDNDVKNYWNTRLKKKLLGKQRKVRQAGKLETKKGCEILYAPPQQSVAEPPLPVVEKQLLDSNSVNDMPPMPQFEAKFSYDHTQPNDQNFETFINRGSDFSCSENHEQAGINFPVSNGVPEKIMYGVLQQLDGVHSFSEVDMVNGSTISSVSEDNSSWGDISSIVYPLCYTNYEVCHQKTPQDSWELII